MIVLLSSFVLSVSIGYLRQWYFQVALSRLFGAEVVGYFFAVALLLSALASLVGGYFSDVVGRRLLIVVGTCVIALSCCLLLMEFWVGLAVVVASLVLLYVGVGVVSSPYSSLVAESVHPRYRGRVFSLVSLSTFLGMAVSSFIAGYLVAKGLLYMYLLSSILAVAAVIARLGLVETRLRSGSCVLSLCSPSSFVRYLREVARLPGLVYLLLFIFFASFSSSLSAVYLPIYLDRFLHLGFSVLGVLYTAMLLVAAFSQPVAGYLVDLLGVRFCVLFALFALGLLMSLFTYFSLLGLFECVYLLVPTPFFSAILSTAYMVYVAKLSPVERRATTYGVAYGLSVVAQSVAPVVGSVLWSLDPYFVPLSIAVTQYVLLPIGFLLR